MVNVIIIPAHIKAIEKIESGLSRVFKIINMKKKAVKEVINTERINVGMAAMYFEIFSIFMLFLFVVIILIPCSKLSSSLKQK